MTTITTRAGKGEPLTHPEVDANFTNLNTDKLESGDTAASLTITTADINGGTIDNTVIGGSTPAAISGTTGTFSGDLTVDTNTLYVDSANNRVGIGTSSPQGPLDVDGSIYYDGRLLPSSTASNGSASAPTIPVGFDYDTGFFRADFNTIGITTGGSERMRITNSGNVGIGTSSPSALLEANTGSSLGVSAFAVSSDSTANFAVTNFASGNFRWCDVEINHRDGSSVDTTPIILAPRNKDIKVQSQTAHNIIFGTNNTERMRIDSSGNVGIGTDNPNYNLVVSDTSSSSHILLQSNNASEGRLWFGDTESSTVGRIEYNHAGNYLNFWTNNSEAMRIDSSGNLLVGTTSMSVGNSANTSDGFGVRQNNVLQIARSSTGSKIILQTLGQTAASTQMAFVYGTSTVGSIQSSSTTTSYNTSSDERLKENIADAQPASDLIDGIQVRQFDWKANGEHQRYGMVAQELEAVAPEAVTKGETEDDMWSVDYSKMVPMLVKEIQDLRKRVDELET